MSPEQEDALIDLLRQVKEVLDEHNVEFWLDCGTLLGAVRDGKFIAWEHDIDLGSWCEKVPETVEISVSKALCDRGFKVWIAENHMSTKREDDLCADINFYRLINDQAIKPTLFPKNLFGKFLRAWLPALWAPYHPRRVSKIKSPVKRFIVKNLINISRAMPSLLRERLAQIVSAVYEKIGSEDVPWIVPSRYFSDLSTMRFYGMEFKVPAETEGYLAYRYGEGWRTPRTDWETVRDDGACQFRGVSRKS